MASTPSFASVASNGSVRAPATADTNLTAPTNTATIISAGASGSKIDEIVVQANATTVAGVCNIFLHDGSTYRLFDQFVITVVTSSTTAAAFRQSRTYTNLILESGWSLRCTVTVAGLQSILDIAAFGGDF